MYKQEVIFKDLGHIPYKQAWDYQEQLLQQAVQSKIQQAKGMETILQPHHLLLCEHPPVYTLGKSGHLENILISEADMAAQGIEFFKTNRGGDITFHGPEQVVGYPILDLEKFYTDIGRYLRELEEVIILTMGEYGLKGERSSGETGVWIDPGVKGSERKICAMGVRCSRWVTMHGFALNVNTNLGYFDNIIPCGIANKRVTSLQQELGCNVDIVEVKEKICRNFEQVFNTRLLYGYMT
ncbi:MAG TPA: lipoyl(octanoyl) transferase LipB [Ferruginibacter sp.]|nr:lipoyl(octanoyl) transferase LipB [Ferruginibacter sp.]HMP20093.1 lipoyl(octanoyl) transferase LipB [Ferruginibacter sp.]